MPRSRRCSVALRAPALAAASLCVCAGGNVAHGQFAPSNPPATFFVLPTSTMGTVTNNLTLATIPNGFIVSGQVIVTIPAGASSGILAQWSVIRRIDPAFSGSGLQTSTILTGFSAPPAGTFGTTTGIVTTDWRFNAGGGFVGGSQSSIPMTLVGGVDSPAWTGLTATSPGGGFTWTAGFFPGAVMQQDFTIFGNYTGGAGGAWVIHVPVTSIVIPAPGAAVLLGLGGLVATRRRR